MKKFLTTILLQLALVAIGSAEETIAFGLSYSPAEVCGQLECQEIRESSGVAASVEQKNLYWTHNDSGDQPRLYAFREDGSHLGVWEVGDAKAIDWEDMAAFRRKGQPTLLIADTGDNLKRRRDYQLYVVDETLPDVEACLKVRQKVHFRYENGSQDCEAVAYDPRRDQIVLVTKEWEPRSEVHVLDWPPEPSEAQTLTTRKVADLSIAGVTGVDISPTGEYAVVTTYGNAYLFRREPEEAWEQGFARPGLPIVVPPRKQGESICFASDGTSLILTSEKLPTPVLRLNGRVRTVN